MQYRTGVAPFLRETVVQGGDAMYSILYIVGAIVVIIVVLKVLGLF